MTVVFTPRLGAAVQLVVLDVDGTLTDGVIHYDSAGNDHRHFHAADGLGIVMAQAVGLKVAVISGRKSAATERRMAELRVGDVIQSSGDKAAALRELMARRNVTAGHVAYVGDDINDLPAFALAGFKIAVADAAEIVRAQADYVTPRPGGHGAVRDAIEAILRDQGRLEEAIAAYLALSASSGSSRQ